ncbi:hypothetical protein VKT23_011699 [Stygiomarasmius scandens]|uniref:Uncharacterized protein n=1 Tax=Marasmiellus scandens TaxID=2682957 RepID=A0ABR1JAF8_9AGAR
MTSRPEDIASTLFQNASKMKFGRTELNNVHGNMTKTVNDNRKWTNGSYNTTRNTSYGRYTENDNRRYENNDNRNMNNTTNYTSYHREASSHSKRRHERKEDVAHPNEGSARSSELHRRSIAGPPSHSSQPQLESSAFERGFRPAPASSRVSVRNSRRRTRSSRHSVESDSGSEYSSPSEDDMEYDSEGNAHRLGPRRMKAELYDLPAEKWRDIPPPLSGPLPDVHPDHGQSDQRYEDRYNEDRRCKREHDSAYAFEREAEFQQGHSRGVRGQYYNDDPSTRGQHSHNWGSEYPGNGRDGYGRETMPTGINNRHPQYSQVHNRNPYYGAPESSQSRLHEQRYGSPAVQHQNPIRNQQPNVTDQQFAQSQPRASQTPTGDFNPNLSGTFPSATSPYHGQRHMPPYEAVGNTSGSGGAGSVDLSGFHNGRYEQSAAVHRTSESASIPFVGTMTAAPETAGNQPNVVQSDRSSLIGPRGKVSNLSKFSLGKIFRRFSVKGKEKI